MIEISTTKAELLEENMKLLKIAIKGWANRLDFLIDNVIEEQEEQEIYLASIIDEMLAFSGV